MAGEGQLSCFQPSNDINRSVVPRPADISSVTLLLVASDGFPAKGTVWHMPRRDAGG
jgi:hypothetical protein